MVVLLMKKIPRGKVKSPKVVLPEENISNDSLVKHLDKQDFVRIFCLEPIADTFLPQFPGLLLCMQPWFDFDDPSSIDQ